MCCWSVDFCFTHRLQRIKWGSTLNIKFHRPFGFGPKIFSLISDPRNLSFYDLLRFQLPWKKKSTRSKSGNKSHQWTKLNETKSFDQPIIHHLCWVLNQGIWQGFLELSNPCVNPCSFVAPHQGPPNCEQTCSLFARSTNCTNKPSCANNEQCKQFDLCEQRTMRTVHTERTVGTANRANSEEYEHFIACE